MSERMRLSRASLRLALVLALSLTGSLALGQEHDHAAMQEGVAPAGSDPHAAHRHMLANTDVKRSIMEYTVPSLRMVRADGIGVSLDKEFNDGRPVVLNFIFTTCTTICPMTSQVFAMLQGRLKGTNTQAHLISISIDPEQDTPARLRAYAARYQAGPAWQHYTGTLQASIQAQQAFDVYRGDKTTHIPVTLVRSTPASPWVRFDGFASADDLLAELQAPMAAAH
ncbi:MAG: SCO family protein [Steroidobacteraceae bacterium]